MKLKLLNIAACCSTLILTTFAGVTCLVDTEYILTEAVVKIRYLISPSIRFVDNRYEFQLKSFAGREAYLLQAKLG